MEVTAAIAVGGLVSAIIFGVQLHEMKVATELTRKSVDLSADALTQTREAMIATQRPWLSIETKIASPLVWKDGDLELQLRVSGKNTGLTPALNARFFAILDPKDGRKGTVVCDAARKNRSAMFGRIVFPGESFETTETAEASAVEVKAGLLKGGKYLAPSLTVCVDYRTAFDQPIHHQTYTTFNLYRERQAAAENDLIDPQEGDVPAIDLRMSYVWGENSAD